MTSESDLKKRLLVVLFILACLALGYVAIQILLYIRPAVVLVSVCILVSYLLMPLVALFDRVLPGRRGHTKRLITILLAYCLIGVLVAILGAYVVPMAGKELNHLTNDLQSIRAHHYVDDLTDWLSARLPPEAQDVVPGYVQEAVDQLQQGAVSLLKGSMPYVGQVFSTIIEAFLIPLFTLFILLDWDTYKNGFMRVVPLRHRHNVGALLAQIDWVLAGFVQGQLVVACVMGTSIALVLWMLHVGYALLLGIFAGVVDIIPYLGVPLGMIPAFFAALSSQGLPTAFLTLLLMETLHMTEGKIVVPTVVGHSVKLPPLVVLLSIFIGAQMMGIIGMLLAIPIVGIVRVVVNHYLPPEESEVPSPATVMAMSRAEVMEMALEASVKEANGDKPRLSQPVSMVDPSV